MRHRSIIGNAWAQTQDCMEWIGCAIYVVCLFIFGIIAGVVTAFVFFFAFLVALLSRGVEISLRLEDEL